MAVVEPDFDVFLAWLEQELTPAEAQRLRAQATLQLQQLGQLRHATPLEASLERFVDTLAPQEAEA